MTDIKQLMSSGKKDILYEEKCKYCTAPDTKCQHWNGTFCSYDFLFSEHDEHDSQCKIKI